MSTTDVHSAKESRNESAKRVALRLEAVVIPVSDVDRAKQFYLKLGWRLDADFPFDSGFRVVQLTPPGSPASLQFGTKLTPAAPGSAQNNYLVVSDIDAACDELIGLGVDVRGPFHAEEPGAQFDAGITTGAVAGPAPDRASYGSYAAFSDPDGNRWLVQEVTVRLPGRVSEEID